MLRPFAGFRESLLVCRCGWFVVNRSIRNRARDGIKHAFQHADSRRQLARRQLVNQFVRVLFVRSHN